MIYENFLAQFTDWRPTALYWQRFSIAEKYGKKEIQDTYNAIFKEAKKDYKLLTELVMTLNHKAWYHNEIHDVSTLSWLYDELYYKAKEYACDHLHGDELAYFYSVTD